MPQILTFPEEQVRELSKDQLEEDTAYFIEQTYGSKFEIDYPSRKNNYCYRIRSLGYVGQIPVSEKLVLHISPKISIQNLFRMLEYVYDLKHFKVYKGEAKLESIQDIFESLASILAKKFRDRISKGLYRNYVGEKSDLSFVRGRINYYDTFLRLLRGSARFQCEYEDFTADLEDNQILLWTLYKLSRLHMERGEVKLRVRQGYRTLYNSVKMKQVEAGDCTGRHYHKLNEDYKPLHAICRFILDYAGPDIRVGDRSFVPFLIYMPILYESFVAKWLEENLPRSISLETQYRTTFTEEKQIEYIIDLVLKDSESGKVLAVMDTKYKRDTKPNTDDIHQVVAYASKMKTRNAVLIYPSEITRSNPLPHGDITVYCITFNIEKDPEIAGQKFLAKLMEVLEYRNRFLVKL